MSIALTLQDLAVCILLYVLHQRLKRASSHPPLPPGPPAEWLLGHLRVVPQKDAARAYYRWSKEYGECCAVALSQKRWPGVLRLRDADCLRPFALQARL